MERMSPTQRDGPGGGGLEDSSALVSRAQAGDSEAWEALYLRYHDPLLFAVRSRLGGALRERVTSEDILHSVVADVFSDIQRFEPRGAGSFGRWLSTCVLNKVRSKAEHFAAGKRAGAVALTDSLASRLASKPVESPRYVDAERWDTLEQSMEELEDAQRETVLLRTVEGLSNAEVALRLNRSPEATSKLYNRAIARLGARIAARGGRAAFP
jgi:RNA polymerase sigma-70 factor (ECF subfamily)